MSRPSQRLLVVSVAALGEQLLRASGRDRLAGLEARVAAPVFPAVTSVAQATFRTASPPSAHGMVANGLYFADLRKVLFWEQSASLVEGPRIWDAFRERGGRVGMIFWQQSLVESCDVVYSPAPIHRHSGGMIQDAYALPRPWGERLLREVGRPFQLFHYWGPVASKGSTEWIVAATVRILGWSDAPDVLFTYLPHLDYNLQRHGPHHPKVAADLELLDGWLLRLAHAATSNGYELLVVGDYAIEAVSAPPVFPNRLLRQAGLFGTRTIKGMTYPDLFGARAFAVADHQVAHVHCRDADALGMAREILIATPGIAEVLGREEQAAAGVAHTRSGDWLLVAEPGTWFAYPWWEDRHEAPDFATHVDIHNKPGFDPAELFWGWPPPSISLDAGRVRGTHGRRGEGLDVAWASTLETSLASDSFLGIAENVKRWLSEGTKLH